MSSISTVPVPFVSNAGHALMGWAFVAMFTPTISSSTPTVRSSSQSPGHAGTGTAVSVGVAVVGTSSRVGVAVAADTWVGEAVRVAVSVGVPTGRVVGV